MNSKLYLYKKTSVISKVIYILLKSSSWSVAGLAPWCQCLPCSEEPAQATYTAQQGRTEISLNLLEIPLPSVAEDTAAFTAARTHPWLLVSMVSARCFCAKLLFSPALVVPDFIPSRGRTWSVPLLKFWRFLLAPFSSLSRLLWVESQPSGAPTKSNFVTSANLLTFIHQILKVEATKPTFL